MNTSQLPIPIMSTRACICGGVRKASSTVSEHYNDARPSPTESDNKAGHPPKRAAPTSSANRLQRAVPRRCVRGKPYRPCGQGLRRACANLGGGPP